MDRYNQIIQDVQRKTDTEEIRWKVDNADRHSEIIFNTYRFIRTFISDYLVGKKNFTLLFVERKVDYYDDFGDSTEGYGFDLYVLSEDGQIVLSRYEGVVDRDDFLKLSGLIDEHNDRVKAFFDAFDESGAA